jgi:hypothetical protein
MPDFSIITCISNADIYDQCLLQSINKMRNGYDIEIIPIINNDNRYSASNALNIGIDVAKSDILVFVHQDVSLLDDWFNILSSTIDLLPENWGMLGSAGISMEFTRYDIGNWGGALKIDTIAVGTVYGSDKSLDSAPYWDGEKNITQVHCVDECLMVLNKKTGLKFDPMFNGFHFYGMDMCLQARAAGYAIWGSHLPIIHYGKYSASFSGDKKYWTYMRLLHHKWNMRFPELLGTHMHWSKDELTSYIPITLNADDGSSIILKSMGLSNVKLAMDKS